jgi:hypothetical protein
MIPEFWNFGFKAYGERPLDHYTSICEMSKACSTNNSCQMIPEFWNFGFKAYGERPLGHYTSI